MLEELGIELIGASAKAIHTAEDREAFGEAMASVGLRVPRSVIVRTPEEARAAIAGELQLPVAIRPAFTLGGHGGGFARTRRGARRDRAARPQREPDLAGAGRGVGRGLGRVRARGDPRQARQRRHRLLDREPRSDGRAHRRLGLLRARDDALRPRVPEAARRGRQGHPRGRRRDRRLERAVRGQPPHRRDRRDRDEPARLALLRAGLEGDRLPDREGRDAARDRLHARRDPERHHRHDAGLVRADDRLRRRQGAALRVREVRGLGRDADDADEVGRRGDGHRPLLQRGLRQGDALARARPRSARGRRARHARLGSLRRAARPPARGRGRRRALGREQRAPVVLPRARAPRGARGRRGRARPRRPRRRGAAAAQARGRVRRAHRAPVRVRRDGGARAPARARRAPGLQDGRLVRRRGRRRDVVPLLELRPHRRAARGRPARPC